MKTSVISILILVALSTLSVVAQSVVPVTIRNAEIDNTEILPFGSNQLNIERNDEFTLKLELFAWKNSKDVEVRAFISGYEYNDVSPIEAQLGPFDFTENVTYVKKMKLKLPDTVDRDSYKLRVEVSDRNGFSQRTTYDLKIDSARHALKVIDVTMNPGSTVKAGQALLARVRVENKGQKEERDVKISVSIPALNVGASHYIEEIEETEQEDTEEMFLRLPKCAQPGTYDVKVDVLFNKDHDRVSGSGKITVLENEDCKPAPIVVQQETSNASVAVAESSTNSGSLRLALEIVLGVLVVLLLIVGVVIGFSHMND